MKPITFPIGSTDRGPAVANLQAALLLFPSDVLTAINPLLIALRLDQAKNTYASATIQLVQSFQKQHGLTITGVIDEVTARLMNELLRKMGHLEEPPREQTFVVGGRVSGGDGPPFKGIKLVAWHESRRLAPGAPNPDGKYTISYPFPAGADKVNLRVEAYNESGALLRASEVIKGAKREEKIDLVLPDRVEPPEPPAQRHLEGRIFFDNGEPAAKLGLRLYRIDFGGAAMRLTKDPVQTNEEGRFAISYEGGGKPVSLEVRTPDPAGTEIPLSENLHDPGVGELASLVLIAPASLRPLAAEYERLAGDLKHHIGVTKLAEVREDAERQDLTVLNRATGWDARLIALAATASRLGTEVKAEQKVDLPEDGLYALLRVGLPSDKQQLAGIGEGTVEKALRTANAAGVAAFSEDRVKEIKTAFQSFSRETRLATKAPGTSSTYRQLLDRSGLRSEKQDLFANLLLAHNGTAAELWQKAEENGFAKAEVKQLQVQGKLAYLTHNNADLTNALQGEIGAGGDLSLLVDKDLHTAAAWKSRVQTLAGGNADKLAELIPPAFGTLDSYAEAMARKVAVSYPNQVVGRMVTEQKLIKDPESAAAAKVFLNKAANLDTGDGKNKGYNLGSIPVDALIRRFGKETFFPGVPKETIDKTVKAMRVIQRVYQFTPSNSAMKVLFEFGLTSAHAVTSLTKDDFLARFGRAFNSMGEADQIYQKASQISAVVDNVANIATQLGQNVPFVIGGSEESRGGLSGAVKEELLKHYPTMESLFGSLDFCECEHCRSVLSPAAYLVDLLKFLEPDDEVWKGFLNDWKSKHNDLDYTVNFMKAFDALVQRRPDLPHLPLTCENTLTALPYIDLVNEILEYYVAHDKLEAKASKDTGEVTTEELLAEPQNVIIEAYAKLKGERYPLALPFDLWLETVRRFFDYFEMPLWKVLEALRRTDKLVPPLIPDDPKPAYYRAEIFAEQLGFSPAEYALMTDPAPLNGWHLLYGYEDEGKALAALRSAKTLSRRLGVTYKEVVALVQTGFVNPQLEALSFLPRLAVGLEDVCRYEKQAGYAPFSAEETTAFEMRLQERADELGLDFAALKDRIDAAWAAGKIGEVLLLRDPATGCNFDKTVLLFIGHREAAAKGEDVYGKDAKAYALVFLKLSLFVRLWRKLGWTIEETDRALQTFLPKNLQPLTEANLGAAWQTALLYLAHLRALDEQVKIGKNSRQRLLTLWSDLPTTGKNPLYAQLFLNRGVLKSDTIFDDPLGQYLSQPGILLKDHLLAVQGALNVTNEEMGRILAEQHGKPASEAKALLEAQPLTLATVSLIYRYGLLAKALKISVDDLIVLKGLSGLNPVRALSKDPVAKIEEDYPFSETLRFVEIAGKVKESGFKIEDLAYLLRHEFDEVGKYRSDPDALLAMVRNLAGEIRRIQSEHAIPADPALFADDVVQQKLALALPPDAAATFFAMWVGTKDYEAQIPGEVPPEAQLKPEAFLSEPAIRVTYNVVLKKQRMIFRGVLLPERKQALKVRFPDAAVASLLDEVEKQASDFFKAQLQRMAAAEPMVGFLSQEDFDALFEIPAPIPEDKPEAEKNELRKQNQELRRRKQKRLAEAFLPFLQKRLIRQFVTGNLSSSLGAPSDLTEALLTDVRLLSNPSQPARPLLEAFTAAGQQGFTKAWFKSTDGTGDPQESSAEAKSARFSGYLEVPRNGAYRFFVSFGAANENAGCEFRFAHLPDPLIQFKATAAKLEESQFTELKANVPYRFTLDLRNLKDANVTLAVLGEDLAKGPLDRLTLYPEAAVERIGRAHLLLSKTVQIIQSLGLGERETRYFLTHPADFDQLNLTKLPTRTVDAAQGAAADQEAKNLFGQLLRLIDYVLLKRDLAPDTSDLIDVFEQAQRTFPASQDATVAKNSMLLEVCRRFATMTRRSPETVKATAEQLGFTAVSTLSLTELGVQLKEFSDERGLRRLWDALQVVEKLGVAPEAVAKWATPKPDFAIARDVRDTVKSKYEPEDWQRIARPIFDKLRQKQRDALVAYVLQHHPENFENVNQLFEYFLIDPGMEPVVQTSRVRLAISSVQLFIQRCLLNLEKHVHPSAINARHWQWMKRYRVWEANRKIFLFPENWLEPEFRDDKTHLFQELEGALLQGDVSSDLVEDAFLTYLKKLEELARLEIVSMYCEENAINPAANTAHVIGRTYNAPRKYFYRRYAQQMWTPWDPVGVEIESDHVAAVMWRDRLHLFWVTFMEKPQPNPQAANNVQEGDSVGKVARAMMANVPLNRVEVQLSWSEYFEGKWSEQRSSAFIDSQRPPSASFNSQAVSVHVTRDFEDGEEGAVRIHLGGGIQRCFKLVSRLSEPRLAGWTPLPLSPYAGSVKATQLVLPGQKLKVSFDERFEGIFATQGSDLCSWAPGRLDLFLRGSDNALWHRSYFGSWSDLDSLDGFLTSDPAAVCWGKGRIDVFARSWTTSLLHRGYDTGRGGWAGWESFDGELTSGPAVSSWAPGRLDVFVRGKGKDLLHKWYDQGWSTGWESLGGVLTSDPAAVSWSRGRIDVFARGLDNSLVHKWYEGGWSGWESLGGTLTSAPTVCSWGPGRLDVFVRGTDNALWHKWYDNGWSNWESLGGVLASDPTAVSWGPGRIDVIARHADDILIHKHFEGTWSDWEPIPGAVGFRVPQGQAKTVKNILLENRDYSLLLSSNPSEFLFPEVGALMRPFFYQNDQHTFFVEPRVTDTTIEKWEEWVVTTPVLQARSDDSFFLKDIFLVAQVPATSYRTPISPSIYARFKVPEQDDWLTHPQVAFEYNKETIGRTGRLNVQPAAESLSFVAQEESAKSYVSAPASVISDKALIVGRDGNGITSTVLNQIKLKPAPVLVRGAIGQFQP